MALEEAVDFAAARETKFLVELSSVVKAENAFWLLREELFGFSEEAKVRVAFEERFKLRNPGGGVLDKPGAWGFWFFAFFLVFFWGFGDKKGCGEMGGEER